MNLGFRLYRLQIPVPSQTPIQEPSQNIPDPLTRVGNQELNRQPVESCAELEPSPIRSQRDAHQSDYGYEKGEML